MQRHLSVMAISTSILLSTPLAHAGCVPNGFREMIFGPSLGISLTTGDQKNNVNTRLSANVALLFANLGLDLSSEDNKKLFLGGVGIGHLGMLQYGQSKDEHVVRLRTELPLSELLPKLDLPKNSYPAATFTLDKINGSAAEKGNYRVGLGLALWF